FLVPRNDRNDNNSYFLDSPVYLMNSNLRFYYLDRSSLIGKLYSTATGLPSRMPGFHFFAFFNVLMADSLVPKPMSFSVLMSCNEPSACTVNLAITVPCTPASMASLG